MNTNTTAVKFLVSVKNQGFGLPETGVVLPLARAGHKGVILTKLVSAQEPVMRRGGLMQPGATYEATATSDISLNESDAYGEAKLVA